MKTQAAENLTLGYRTYYLYFQYHIRYGSR